MATFYDYFFIFVYESIIYLNRCVSSFTQSITAFFVNAFISTLLSFYSLPSLLPSLLSPLTFSILYFSPPIIFPPLLSSHFLLPSYCPIILLHHTPLCVLSQVRQAELEQSNMELSIGITERQREITRLKILQEQVATLLHNAHTTHKHTQHTHTPHTALIILHRIRELNPTCHSTNLPSLALSLLSLSLPFLLPFCLSPSFSSLFSLCHILLSFLYFFTAFQEGREDVHASVREVS